MPWDGTESVCTQVKSIWNQTWSCWSCQEAMGEEAVRDIIEFEKDGVAGNTPKTGCCNVWTTTTTATTTTTITTCCNVAVVASSYVRMPRPFGGGSVCCMHSGRSGTKGSRRWQRKRWANGTGLAQFPSSSWMQDDTDSLCFSKILSWNRSSFGWHLARSPADV